MTLTKDVFVKLSYHAKMHKMLSFGNTYTQSEQTFHEAITLQEEEYRARNTINLAIEKVERKALEFDEPNEDLIELKKFAKELRQEFDQMKE